MSSHTILLVQPTRKPEGRTYSDYESVNDCMEVIFFFISNLKRLKKRPEKNKICLQGVCKIYEEHLKRLNPSSPQITYDISQV